MPQRHADLADIRTTLSRTRLRCGNHYNRSYSPGGGSGEWFRVTDAATSDSPTARPDRIGRNDWICFQFPRRPRPGDILPSLHSAPAVPRRLAHSKRGVAEGPSDGPGARARPRLPDGGRYRPLRALDDPGNAPDRRLRA